MDGGLRPQWLRGRVSRQAHADLPGGTVEEEHGREGFSGPASHLYRLRPPTSWTSIDGPLRPRALDPTGLRSDEAGWPVTLLANDQVRIGWWALDAPPGWFCREADGDVAYFIHTGSGTLGTEYGPLAYGPGDLVVVPRATTHRFEPRTPTAVLRVCAVEGRLDIPDRGLLGRHALFDPAVLEVPEPAPVDEAGPARVVVHRRGSLTTVTYPHHPFDVVGWKGDLAPVRLPAGAFRPVVSARYHLPPSAHTVLSGPGLVIAMFAPRPLETDPAVLRVPFFHRNVDYDEVIFYHRGEFFSRAGIREGMLTFHPAGIHHGPQPAAVRRAETRGPGGTADEVALNVDTRRPLRLSPAGEAVCVAGYELSWRQPDSGG